MRDREMIGKTFSWSRGREPRLEAAMPYMMVVYSGAKPLAGLAETARAFEIMGSRRRSPDGSALKG